MIATVLLYAALVIKVILGLTFVSYLFYARESRILLMLEFQFQDSECPRQKQWIMDRIHRQRSRVGVLWYASLPWSGFHGVSRT